MRCMWTLPSPHPAEVRLILLNLLGSDVTPGEHLPLDLVAAVEEEPRPYGNLSEGDNEMNAPSAAGYLDAHGCPVAFYSDKHSVFRINRDAQGGQGMTQFGRALAELNIEIICANSSQARAAWSESTAPFRTAW